MLVIARCEAQAPIWQASEKKLMPRKFTFDVPRLFKSVPKEFDPRKVGTLRLGSLTAYRRHYDEEVVDVGEGTGTVSIRSDQSVTLNAELASALMGLEIMGKKVPRPGQMLMKVGKPGLSFATNPDRNEVTLSGADCSWEFVASDALVFCMTAPSKDYANTFSGDRVVWSIARSDVDEFTSLVLRGIEEMYPAEAGFPFLNGERARTYIHVEHGPVSYVPRDSALTDTEEGQLAALLFTNATFIKPSGPPRNFELEEEYRFQFRCTLPDGRLPQSLPDFIDVPFAPIEHLVEFQ